MADYIEVDTSELERDRQTIQSELNKVRAGIRRLQEEMTELGSMWEGPAHDAFMTQVHADYETIRQFANEIAAYIEAMSYARTEYEQCEHQAERAVASLRI